MKSYLSPRQNPIQSMYFVIGSKCHFSSQQMPPKNKYTNSPKTWKWKLPWRKSVPRCLLVDKSESNNNVLIIISKSKCISRKSCLMPCLKTILNCFALEHSAFKTKHLKVINGFLPIKKLTTNINSFTRIKIAIKNTIHSCYGFFIEQVFQKVYLAVQSK